MSPRTKHEYELISDVVNEESPLVRSESQRRRRRNHMCSSSRLAPLGLAVVFTAMMSAVFITFRHPEGSLGPQIMAAQALVRRDEDGLYSVGAFPDDDILLPNTTFAELADRMLAPWYEATLMAVEDDLDPDKLKPSNVGNAREMLLMTRNLMDAFSPVYPQYSLWRKLRKQIDKGYEKMGHLQDLDHSGVDYNEELLHECLQDVLDWKVDFALFRQRHHVRLFVYHGASPDQCVRHKSSHLFWGKIATLPCGHDLAQASLQNLGRVQLSTCANYWQIVQDYDTVVPAEREDQFHNLRKELRIFLDEYNMFGEVMLQNPDEDSLHTLDRAQTKLGHINDEWTAYNIYVTRGTHPEEQGQLATNIDDLWEDFQAWARYHKLTEVILSTLDTLS